MILKVLADVGIVGFPSVGKSTFISVISNARPKIADYPFTTLAPNLGMVRHHDQDFVVADLPGLIENASEGLGLGIRFLKHIERCRIFLHMVDLTDEDPFKSYNIINNELGKYNKELLNRKQILVLNKADAVSPERLEEVKKQFEGLDLMIISAVARIGVDELLGKVVKELNDIPAITYDDVIHELYELDDIDEEVYITRRRSILYYWNESWNVLWKN